MKILAWLEKLKVALILEWKKDRKKKRKKDRKKEKIEADVRFVMFYS